MNQKHILLVEDDNLLRIGLKSMLDLHGEYVVDRDVATGRDAIQSFEHNAPDIILLDLKLPDMPGTDVLKKIKESDPNSKVIILSAHNDNEMIYEALEHGADAYVLKGANPDEVFLAINYTLSDDLFISPRLARTVVRDYLFVNRQRKTLPPLQNLTAREKEIARHIIDGKKSKEIAQVLFISVKTVDKHRSNILGKLGISSCNELRRGSIHLIDDFKDN